MPHGRTFTQSELKEHCAKYAKYLAAQNLTSGTNTKEKLRDLYCREYKASSGQPTPSFSQLLYSMRRFSIVKMCDGEYVQFLGRYKKSNDVTQADTPPPPTTAGPGIPRPHRVHRQSASSIRVSLSVDQHVSTRPQNRKNMECGVVCSGTEFVCKLCRITANSASSLESHRQGKTHLANCYKFLLELKKPNMLASEYPIVVTAEGTVSNEAEGIMSLYLTVGTTKRININIRNAGDVTVVLQLCEMLQSHESCDLDDPKGVTVSNKSLAEIPAGTSYNVLATCSSKDPGYNIVPIVFGLTAKYPDKDSYFLVLRCLVLVTETELMDELKPVSPYKPPPRSALLVEGDIVPGERLGSDHLSDELIKILPLKWYNIPVTVQTLVNHGMKPFDGISERLKKELERYRKLLDDGLDATNYRDRFQTLLFFEEIQMSVDIRQYDMKSVTMHVPKENPKLLALHVPGLAEKRPSVLKGDRLYAQEVTGKKVSSVEYEGYVHMIRESEVWLGFHKRFRDKFVAGMLFHIRFSFTRTPIKLQHRAVCLAEELRLTDLLFPEFTPTMNFSEADKLELNLFNPLLANNDQQQQAVKAILAGTSLPAPYIIFGPPGTGKTVTVVEAIMQVWQCYPNSHILACATSNSAADLIVDRLLKSIPASNMLRLMAVSRNWADVPEAVKKCTNYDRKQEKYIYPVMTKLLGYRIIVSTLVTAGRLVSAQFLSGHFTHVFIDEAGHAIEPEVLIPVAVLQAGSETRGGQLVIAGDPKQLGPVLRSPLAIRHGLAMSHMERLMTDRDIFARGEDNSYNPAVITKLLRNYRSHPSILHVPNELFYLNELLACSDPEVHSVLAQWETLPAKNFPIIFHGVIGKDEQEARSPSFFNRAEIQVVVDYVQDILSTRSNGINVQPKEIGIISPYSQQVRKIRQAMEKMNRKISTVKQMHNKNPTAVTVGSTEEFQGQERNVIIISTVRSNPDLLKIDSKYRLGFLKNPKRFNVALTRAKYLLIVVGNPHLLRLDSNWNRFLEFCMANKAYVGCRYKPDDDDDDLIERMKLLDLDQEDGMSLEDVIPLTYEHTVRDMV